MFRKQVVFVLYYLVVQQHPKLIFSFQKLLLVISLHVLYCAMNPIDRFKNLLNHRLIWFAVVVVLLRRLFYLLFIQLHPQALQLKLIISRFLGQLQRLLKWIDLPLQSLDRASVLLLTKNVHLLFLNQVPLYSLRVLWQLAVLPPNFIVFNGPILAVHLDS